MSERVSLTETGRRLPVELFFETIIYYYYSRYRSVYYAIDNCGIEQVVCDKSVGGLVSTYRHTRLMWASAKQRSVGIITL